jgi:hypothetical protein
VPRDDEHLGRIGSGTQLLQEDLAGTVGQRQVEQDEGGVVGATTRLGKASGRGRRMPLRLEKGAQQIRDLRVVVDHQHRVGAHG